MGLQIHSCGNQVASKLASRGVHFDALVSFLAYLCQFRKCLVGWTQGSAVIGPNKAKQAMSISSPQHAKRRRHLLWMKSC